MIAGVGNVVAVVVAAPLALVVARLPAVKRSMFLEWG